MSDKKITLEKVLSGNIGVKDLSTKAFSVNGTPFGPIITDLLSNFFNVDSKDIEYVDDRLDICGDDWPYTTEGEIKITVSVEDVSDTEESSA